MTYFSLKLANQKPLHAGIMVLLTAVTAWTLNSIPSWRGWLADPCAFATLAFAAILIFFWVNFVLEKHGLKTGIAVERLDGHMKRYVVTGAPGAGKTAIIRQLEIDGFGVVEEAATDVIALWQANGIAEPWTRPEFIDAIISLQQTRERRAVSATDSVQFHDRSVVCTAALADYLGFPRPQTLLRELRRVRAENVFQDRVLFLKNLGFITPTDARKITFEETVHFEQIHERTYRDLGFEITLIEPGSVSDRVKQIKHVLSLERT